MADITLLFKENSEIRSFNKSSHGCEYNGRCLIRELHLQKEIQFLLRRDDVKDWKVTCIKEKEMFCSPNVLQARFAILFEQFIARK